MAIKGNTWVGVWTVYIMVMMQVAYWMKQPLDHWITLLQTVLGGYIAYGTITKSVTAWANRFNIKPGE